MRQTISTLPVILFFMKLCVPRTFLVECQLGVVLEVLLVIGSKLVNKFHRNIVKIRMIY